MAFEFELPDVGEGIAEGELVSWLVDVGETVTEDQPLAEVETDKAMVDIPAPLDGTVTDKRFEEGEMVPVGAVFVVIEPESEVDAAEIDVEPGDTAADSGADTAGAASRPDEADDGGDREGAGSDDSRVFAAPSARRLARELGVDITTVEGSGPSGRVTERDVRAHAGDGSVSTATDSTGQPADSASPSPGTETEAEATAADVGLETGDSTTTEREPAHRDRTLAVPATRRVAEELDVDINAVPTDETRDGEPFVTASQVREFAQAQAAPPTATGGSASAASTDATESAREERIQYKGIRQTIGDAMVESKFTAPHVTHHDTAVVDELVETRQRLRPIAEERGINLTYMPFVMKAVVAALKQHPKLNAELDDEAGEIIRKRYYHIGVATATEAGLMVPVVENVDAKGLLQISSEVNELVKKARDRSISREELQGSTFTVTNFGAIGGEYATPILNHPEVGILGIGELTQRPVVEDGDVVASQTLPISLTIDHRIVDGADAAKFANTVMEYLENPELLLLE